MPIFHQNRSLSAIYLGLCSGVSLGGYILASAASESVKSKSRIVGFLRKHFGNFRDAAVCRRKSFVVWTGKDIFAVVMLGVFQIGLAYFLFTYGVTHGVRSLDASIIGFIEPLLNPVWVFLFIGEKPSNWAILGGSNYYLRRRFSHPEAKPRTAAAKSRKRLFNFYQIC